MVTGLQQTGSQKLSFRLQSERDNREIQVTNVPEFLLQCGGGPRC